MIEFIIKDVTSNEIEDVTMTFLDGKPVLIHLIDKINELNLNKFKVTIFSSSEKNIKNIKYLVSNLIDKDLLNVKLINDSNVDKGYDLNDIDDSSIIMILNPLYTLLSSHTLKEVIQLISNIRENTIETVVNIENSVYINSKMEEFKAHNFKKKIDAIKVLRNLEVNDTDVYYLELKNNESLILNSYYNFYNGVGQIFFDYKKRERKNYGLYEKEYYSRLLGDNNEYEGIIVGDSRLEKFNSINVKNFAMGGITANVFNKLIMSKVPNVKFKKIVIGLGINDILINKSDDEIIKNIVSISNFFTGKEIIILEIFPTIYRVGITNERVRNLNKKLSQIQNTKFYHYPEELKDGLYLNFELTDDGLHLNTKGNEIYFKYIDNIVHR